MATGTVPDHFLCPITHEVMRDPVIDNEGVSYEKDAILTWLRQGHNTSPSTGNRLREDDLRPNLALRNAIEQHNNGGTIEQGAAGVSTNEGVIESRDDAADYEKNPKKQVSETQQIDIGLETHFDGKNVMVTLQPPEGVVTVASNICCVVDISGSMSSEAVIQNEQGERESFGLSVLDVVKHALKTIVSSLSPIDKFSLVTFSDDATVVMKPTLMTAVNSQTALTKVEGLHVQGMTNLWAGLEAGLKLMSDNNAGAMNSAVFLLTDGLPNRSPGKGEVKALQSYSSKHKGLPCIINTFGFGYTMDSEMLSGLSSTGNGAYSFIPDSSFVGTVFVNAVANHLTTAAADLTLTITTNKKVKIDDGPYKVYGGNLDSHQIETTIGTIQFDQSKNVVFPVQVSGDAKIEVSLKYYVGDKKKKIERIEKCDVVCAPQKAADIKYHSARLELVGGIDTGMEEADIQYTSGSFNARKLQNGVKSIEKCTKTLKGKIDKDERSTDLLKDLSGQLTEAFSKKEFMEKWGVHYCRSIRAAHLYQVCNNFKDPGVQHYTGGLFEETRDKLDDIFVKLPAPKPSLQRATYGTGAANNSPINMRRFMNMSGGCIHGKCVVHLADRQFCAVNALQKGDQVLTGTGLIDTVECVLETQVEDQETQFVRYHNNLLITPWHPVKNDTSGKWEFPVESGCSEEIVHTEAVYTVLLKNRGTMLVNGVECATLAHGLSGDIIGHKFLGTEAIVRDMETLDGFDNGRIFVTSECFKRDVVTGQINAISF